MECMSFSRLFMAVSLILIYVIQKLVGLADQASPVNLKPLHEDMDVRQLAFEDQLQFIDPDNFKTDAKLLDDIQLDSVSVSYLSVSVLLFELNERQGCLGVANYSVIRTFSAVNVGQMVLQIRGFKIGSSSASNILRGRLYNLAKSKSTQQQQQQQQKHQQQNQQQPNQNRYQQPQPQSQQQQQQQSICRGYGFTIYDCEPFDLEPNHEHKIRIAFNPDFTLTKTIVSLTILTNMDEEFKFALVASIPRNLLATCNQSLPRPEWEPTMHLILAFGMVIMILVSILTAYMEAMLYLRSQQATSALSTNGQTSTQCNHHNGGSNKDYERSNCSNHSKDTCNKDRSNGSGHGASAISASVSNQQQSNPLTFNALTNGGGKNNTINLNKNNSNNNGKANNCTQKRRKNSSTANSEKVPTSNKSIGSTTNDKKSSSPYAPIFQNLTNVISSPPPPLPTFDTEFDSLEFKKLRGKRSAKKSNSLNGSIASSDDIGNPSSLNQSNVHSSNQSGKAKANGKSGLKMSGSNSINGERESELQGQLGRVSRAGSQNRKGSLKDVFTSTTDEGACSDNIKLYNGVKVDRGQQEQPTVMPIQPPSSLSSTPSSSSSSTASTSSSTSFSPPLSASSYGEYSLLGPGATFELPCLRVRSAQI